MKPADCQDLKSTSSAGQQLAFIHRTRFVCQGKKSEKIVNGKE
jgi:hypothetical protein